MYALSSMIGGLSGLGFFISLVWLIVRVVRKKPLKKVALICVSTFVAAGMFSGIASNTEEGKRAAEKARLAQEVATQQMAAQQQAASQQKPQGNDNVIVKFNSKTGESEVVGTAPPAQAAVEVNNSDSNNVIKQGDTFKLGKFSYRVKKVETRTGVGNRYFGHQAQEGAVLVLVHYDIFNQSNETETVMADDFQLNDYNGRSFRTSSEASTAYMMTGGKKDFLLSEIQPGLKREMTSVFEVPKDSVSTKGLVLIIPEKGWGSGKVSVPLN